MGVSTLVRVRLGRTNLMVSPVCFGSWQLSPRFWGKVSEDEVTLAVRRAAEVGVNFYDTADAYGEGLSERVLGQALKPLPREQVILATKVFWHFYEDGHRHPDLTPAYIRQGCEASLRRLQMDYIDLYQLHAWDPLVDMAEIAGALESLRQQGKIRHYGVSNWTVEQMRLGHHHGNFATCQPPYSLLKRGIEADLLPYCQANDVGTLVYSPLQNGLLTGKYRGTETFDDFRKNSPDFQGERFKLICDRVQQLAPLARKYDLTILQLVLAVSLMHPGVTCVIVGIKSAAQIEEAAGGMGRRIGHEDAHQVRSLLSV